ncbi:hypothetical protein ES703_77887 [subsurface metagenome]
MAVNFSQMVEYFNVFFASIIRIGPLPTSKSLPSLISKSNFSIDSFAKVNSVLKILTGS